MRKSEERELGARRKRLLSDLTGTVLEIGSGTGVNFLYYPETTQVHATDPSPSMVAKAAAKSRANITLLNLGVDDSELMDYINEQKFDAIVCTLVLCTVPDVNEALEKFLFWLKPGGQLVVLEHIRSKKEWTGKFEDFIAPAWKLLGAGCHINRKTDELIVSKGFHPIREEYFSMGAYWYEAVYQAPS